MRSVFEGGSAGESVRFSLLSIIVFLLLFIKYPPGPKVNPMRLCSASAE